MSPPADGLASQKQETPCFPCKIDTNLFPKEEIQHTLNPNTLVS